MFNYRFAIILICFWISAGCQHAYMTATPSDDVNPPSNLEKETHETADLTNPSGSNELNAVNTEQKKYIADKERPKLSDISIESRDKTQTPALENISEVPAAESDTPPQDKIDQALELCNYAHKMWEKGKLEEALGNLDSAYSSILEVDSDLNPQLNQQKEDIRYLISKRILEIYASRQIVINGQHNEIPLTLNAYVEKEIKRLTGRERKFMIQSLERSQRYRPFIVAELKKAGLPEELSWLPLIESGFKIRALSPARALGLWQFIPSTGYKFGLNRNYYVDERLDPEKSTRAAIAYLKELHNLFGDWTTALAAYNCGESRVLRIIRNQRINYLDNFWDLYQSLPRETSRYVPRFLATLHIINNLDKYNIKIKTPLTPVPYTVCDIKKQVRLKDIAKEIGVNTSVLKELNAELRYSLLPPEVYPLKVPKDKAELFLSKIDSIKTTYSPQPMIVYHRVRSGETLSGISKRYHVSIRSISAVNNINRSYRIYAGKVLKIPTKNSGTPVNRVAVHQIAPGKTLKYKVRRGDNLWKIARKFGTTTKTIMAVNGLSGTNLSIGQTLRITSKTQLAQKSAKKQTDTHRVRSGDSPFSIAKKYNMNLNRLLALNQLNKRSKIFPGQKLIVE